LFFSHCPADRTRDFWRVCREGPSGQADGLFWLCDLPHSMRQIQHQPQFTSPALSAGASAWVTAEVTTVWLNRPEAGFITLSRFSSLQKSRS